MGDSGNLGLKLINQADQVETSIPATSILVNEPSKVTFIVPANLQSGDYKLSLTTQFSHSVKSLKEPRTCVFDYVLNVS